MERYLGLCCGQGIGVINEVPSAEELVERLVAEYDAAFAWLADTYGK